MINIFLEWMEFSTMDGFPSGQRGQTVNLLQIASVVRIHPHPFADDPPSKPRGFVRWRDLAAMRLLAWRNRQTQGT